MGAVCCCFRDEWEDYGNPSSSLYRNCICLRCFLQNLLYMHTSLFGRGEEHGRLGSPSFIQRTVSFDDSLSNVYHSPPRPLPYDTDPRYLCLQRDGLISRWEKGSSHSQEECEPLTSDADMGIDPLCVGSKRNNNFMWEDEAKNSESQTNSYSTTKETTGFEHIYAFSEEDEDVCPTCLEEYTTENPKIITKCSHHFHLGCIYEWMERSETCPVCGKVMAFDETT